MKQTFGRLLKKSNAWMVAFCICTTAIFPGVLAGCSAQAAHADILINEAVTSNSHSLVDPILGSPDWIELYNPTGNSIDLAGYRLTDKPKNSGRGVLPNISVPAGGYIVVRAVKGGAPAGSGQCCVNFSLSSTGIALFLINQQNVVVSQLTVPALPCDVSYARRDNGSYGLCTSPTPGMKNNTAGILDADALKKALQTGALRLNEVMPKPGDGSPWAEVYNAGQSEIDLSDYCLTDQRGSPNKWHFPASKLEPGQYAVVGLTGQNTAGSNMQASFKLGSDGTSLYLYDVTGNLVGSMTWSKGILKGISVVTGNRYTAFPTKGALNSTETFSSIQPTVMDSTDPVRLNEVLPKNKYSLVDSDGDRKEWAELYNASKQPMDLKNYFLTDNQNDLLKWKVPDMTIAPDSYLIVYLSGKQSKAGELHASFRLSQGESIWLTSFGSGGIRTDEVALPASLGANVSVGRDAQGNPQYYTQPTPGAPNAKGYSDPALAVPFDKDGLYISEVCAAETPRAGLNDWIELHNASDADIDLSGYSLSDKPDKPDLWKIPAMTVKAGGYAVIEASNAPKNTATADFGISSSGETLLLSDSKGTLLDRFDTGVLSPGITSGRQENTGSSTRVYFSAPTRGNPNSATSLSGYTATPTLSDTGLYHSKTFEVSITCATPGAKIYYTTDGSVPTTASKTYATPVTITKSTPLRAVAYMSGCLPSLPVTQTYLFDSPHTVPVVCLTGNPGDMNVLLKFNKFRVSKPISKPEYAGYAEYYENDGTLGVAFPTGIRPKGRLSLQQNPQKSFKLTLGSDFGEKTVTYPFFPGTQVKTFRQLTLRDSGQDLPFARMRDTLFQRISDGMDVTTIQTRIVVVYVNGQYEGVFDLDEQENPDYLASHYNVDANKIDMINRNTDAMHGSITEYNRVLEMAKTLNTADNAQFEEYSKYVDVDACTDFLIAQTYWGSGDIVNIRFWRTQDYSQKWQPLYFDLDFCLFHNNVNRNEFRQYLTPAPNLLGSNIPVNMDIYYALMKNAAWRDKFVQRYIQLAETQYAPGRILKIFDDLKAEMQPEMAQDIARWHEPSSMQAWESQTAGLRKALADRQSVALRQLQAYFNVPEATMQKYIAMYLVKN